MEAITPSTSTSTRKPFLKKGGGKLGMTTHGQAAADRLGKDFEEQAPDKTPASTYRSIHGTNRTLRLKKHQTPKKLEPANDNNVYDSDEELTDQKLKFSEYVHDTDGNSRLTTQTTEARGSRMLQGHSDTETAESEWSSMISDLDTIKEVHSRFLTAVPTSIEAARQQLAQKDSKEKKVRSSGSTSSVASSAHMQSTENSGMVAAPVQIATERRSNNNNMYQNQPTIEAQATDSKEQQYYMEVLQGMESKAAQYAQENSTLRKENGELRQLLKNALGGLDEAVLKVKAECKREMDEELKKAKESVRVSERQKIALSKYQNQRKDRDEISKLQKQIQKLQSDLAAKETTFQLALEKSKSQNEVLHAQISKLSSERDATEQQVRHRASEREKELQEAFDELYCRNQELHQQLSNLKAGMAASGVTAVRSPGPNHTSIRVPPPQHAKDANNSKGRVMKEENIPEKKTEEKEHQQDQEMDKSILQQTNQASLSTTKNGAIEQVRADGVRTVLFKNGSSKEFMPDGRTIVRFANGDVKETSKDGTVTYFYSSTRTTQISYTSGVQLIHFSNGQMQKEHPDGSLEVVFPTGIRKVVRPDGTETVFRP